MLPLVFLEMMSEEGVACKAGVFLTEAQMYINCGCHFDPTSPLESFFDLPQLSGVSMSKMMQEHQYHQSQVQNTPALQAEEGV